MKKLLIISASILINLNSVSFAADTLSAIEKETIVATFGAIYAADYDLLFQEDTIPFDPQLQEIKTTFDAIQKVRELAVKTAQSVKKYNLMMGLSTDVYHSINQTSQGLFLKIRSHSYSLCTPWGQVGLYYGMSYYIGGGGYREVENSEEKMIFDKFEETLQLKLVEENGEDNKSSLYKILAVGSALLPEPEKKYDPCKNVKDSWSTLIEEYKQRENN